MRRSYLGTAAALLYLECVESAYHRPIFLEHATRSRQTAVQGVSKTRLQVTAELVPKRVCAGTLVYGVGLEREFHRTRDERQHWRRSVPGILRYIGVGGRGMAERRPEQILVVDARPVDGVL